MFRHGSHGGLPQQDAVVVRHAHKSYDPNNPVLLAMNMTVQHGSVYGLLGSSGCGKTTILSCILGEQKLDRGDVHVFGCMPGTKRSGIPGPHVGYMPQDISLLPEFSVEETLAYFGGLVGLEDEEIQSRIAFLSNLLNLPKRSSVISTLSGGQQRRVSLSVALIHRPRLLILDEPTVGVDPLLRHRIWEHLKELATLQRTTIIITTHYVEECRRADRIGIMGNGCLLEENAPSDLLQKYGLNSLESIVLHLFKENPRVTLPTGDPASGNEHSTSGSVTVESISESIKISSGIGTKRRILAVAVKSISAQIRSPLLLFFVVLFPSLALSIAGVSLGNDPGYLGLGIVNDEVQNHSACNIVRSECTIGALSCKFITAIPPKDFNLKWFTTKERAQRAITDGTIWGYISFPNDFSDRFVPTMTLNSSKIGKTRNASRISIQLDETNTLVARKIKTSLFSTYGIFLHKLISDCEYNPRMGRHSLEYRSPIFGASDTNFKEYLLQSITPPVMFFYPVVTTSIRLIGEKRSGVITRLTIIGVTIWEVLCANILSASFISILQVFLAYGVTTLLFGVKILGSHFIVILIYLLSSFGGVSLGLVLASACADEFQASLVAISTFLPTVFLSGVMWPVEGLGVWLQHIVQAFPCTLSAEATRSVIGRGWELTHPHVWPGLVVPLQYILGFLIVAVLLIRAKGY